MAPRTWRCRHECKVGGWEKRVTNLKNEAIVVFGVLGTDVAIGFWAVSLVLRRLGAGGLVAWSSGSGLVSPGSCDICDAWRLGELLRGRNSRSLLSVAGGVVIASKSMAPLGSAMFGS